MKPAFIFFLLLTWNAFAQSPVRNFSLLNIADNKKVSLEDYQSCSGLVIIFTGNECVYDHYYIERIKSLVDAYKGKIQFLLVNSYLEPEESIEKMKMKYNSWTLGIPYLADKEQVAMESLGAHKSPEAFLLKNNGGKYIVAYSGAIDDNAQVATDAKQNYLKDAIEKILSNQKLEGSNVRPAGCTIRRK